MAAILLPAKDAEGPTDGAHLWIKDLLICAGVERLPVYPDGVSHAQAAPTPPLSMRKLSVHIVSRRLHSLVYGGPLIFPRR